MRNDNQSSYSTRDFIIAVGAFRQLWYPCWLGLCPCDQSALYTQNNIQRNNPDYCLLFMLALMQTMDERRCFYIMKSSSRRFSLCRSRDILYLFLTCFVLNYTALHFTTIQYHLRSLSKNKSSARGIWPSLARMHIPHLFVHIFDRFEYRPSEIPSNKQLSRKRILYFYIQCPFETIFVFVNNDMFILSLASQPGFLYSTLSRLFPFSW